jgi:hypothetical protein
MECNNIQERLSAYLEGVISPEEKILIDEHLKSCQRCNESLAELKRTIQYVQDLEDVEPPVWLTRNVMTRIRSEVKPKKGILQKLFYPLRIKLPLEAAAVFLIAVTAIYIFKTIQSELKLAKAPSEEITTQIPSREKEKIPPSPPLEKGGKRGFKTEQTMPTKKPEIMYKLAEEPKAPAPATATKQEETGPFTGAVARDESRTEALSRGAKAKALAERKRVIISLTINVNDIKTASKEIEKALTQLKGKIIKTKSLENKDIITAKLNSQKIKELIEKLKLVGEIEEKEVGLEGLEGNIEIRIEIAKIPMQRY